MISCSTSWALGSEPSSCRHSWRNLLRSSFAASSSRRGRFTFIETDWWCFWMSSLTQENAGSPGRRFRMLSRSANRTSLEASSSEHRADKLLVRSSLRMVCSLANAAIRVQTATCSISFMLPIWFIIWRCRVWKHSTTPHAASKSFSSWHVVSIGDAALLLPAIAGGAPSGTGVSLGDSSAPADSHSGSGAALLVLSHRQFVSIVIVSMRSVSMFQCKLEGGLRDTAILGPCHMLGGNFSGSYTSMGVATSPRRRGKVI